MAEEPGFLQKHGLKIAFGAVAAVASCLGAHFVIDVANLGAPFHSLAALVGEKTGLSAVGTSIASYMGWDSLGHVAGCVHEAFNTTGSVLANTVSPLPTYDF